MIDKGIFVTPDIDTMSLNGLKDAAAVDVKELVSQLTGHGRFKRAQFFPWESITALRMNKSCGSIEIEADSETTTVKVADRERLEKLARVLAVTHAAQTTELSAES